MLQPLQAQRCLGQFDGLDSELTSLLGGEVVGFASVAVSGSDVSAYDVGDGYDGTTTHYRPAVTKTLVSGMRPLYLADEGISGYGTLLGSVVGGSAGKQVTGGATLGPHTTAGSGKVTLWGEPGLYAVTLDAVDTTGSTGLVTDNTSLTIGKALFATTAGKLTPNSSAKFESVVVGRFIEFATNASKVTSSLSMVSALHSPWTNATSLAGSFTRAIIDFRVETGVAGTT